MKPEAQRIAIAEALGFKKEIGCTGIVRWRNEEKLFDKLPDYLNDLNAMQGAMFSLSGIEQDAFSEELCRIVFPHSPFQNLAVYEVVCATASQRAKAFLQILNLWTDDT
jgi:hypothetical protein